MARLWPSRQAICEGHHNGAPFFLFGAIARGEGKALKCDRACLDEDGVPACVRACPTGALVYQTVEEFEAERRRAAVAALVR